VVSGTVYARVSDEAKQWLDAQHLKTGIPIAKIIDAILRDAAERRVNLEVRLPVLVRDDGETE
jgi:hypothetical protein